MTEKVSLLNTIGELCLFEYDTMASPIIIEKHLQFQMNMFDPDIIVGTSLGGYWACRMSSLNAKPCVMINPSIFPSTSLKENVGTHINYVNGKEGTLTEESVDQYIDVHDIDLRGMSCLVLLDADDELLDSDVTREALDNLFDVRAFEGGCHRFDHMADSLELIEQLYNRNGIIE